jgi:hypothetical protein
MVSSQAYPNLLENKRLVIVVVLLLLLFKHVIHFVAGEKELVRFESSSFMASKEGRRCLCIFKKCGSIKQQMTCGSKGGVSWPGFEPWCLHGLQRRLRILAAFLKRVVPLSDQ